MYLIFHVTSHDHVTERAWEFVVGSTFSYVTTLISLVALSIVMVEIWLFNSHMTCRENVLKAHVMWIYGWKSVTVSHYLAMFGSHLSITSGDKKYLTSHAILQNHIIKGSSNFISWSSLCISPLFQVWWP